MQRYIHRKLTPAEFSRLLQGAKLTLGDFLMLSGRRRQDMEKYLSGKTDFRPTMSDALVLELAQNETTQATMWQIVEGRYYERAIGDEARKKRRHGDVCRLQGDARSRV